MGTNVASVFVCASFSSPPPLFYVLLENELQFPSTFFYFYDFFSCNLAQMVCGQVLSVILLPSFIGMLRECSRSVAIQPPSFFFSFLFFFPIRKNKLFFFFFPFFIFIIWRSLPTRKMWWSDGYNKSFAGPTQTSFFFLPSSRFSLFPSH